MTVRGVGSHQKESGRSSGAVQGTRGYTEYTYLFFSQCGVSPLLNVPLKRTCSATTGSEVLKSRLHLDASVTDTDVS